MDDAMYLPAVSQYNSQRHDDIPIFTPRPLFESKILLSLERDQYLKQSLVYELDRESTVNSNTLLPRRSYPRPDGVTSKFKSSGCARAGGRSDLYPRTTIRMSSQGQKYKHASIAGGVDVCDGCGKQDDGTLEFCTGCHLAMYCGKHCQKKSWKKHKKICRKSNNDRDLMIQKIKNKWRFRQGPKETEGGSSLNVLAHQICYNNFAPHPSRLSTMQRGLFIRHLNGVHSDNDVWNLAEIHPYDAFKHPDWVVDWGESH